MANMYWQRWTYASFAVSILADMDAASIATVVEGLNPKRTAAWESASTRVEFTISGPDIQKQSPTRHKVDVSVFAVISSDISNNNYAHLDAVGEVTAALDKCFLVKDYGATGLIDIGNLSLTDASDGVRVTHLKPSAADTKLHSTVAASYDGKF